MGTIITGILLFLIVAAALAKIIHDHKHGRRHLSCGGNCSSCGFYDTCSAKKQTDREREVDS